MRKPKKPNITKRLFSIQEEIYEWELYKTERLTFIAMIFSIITLIVTVITSL